MTINQLHQQSKGSQSKQSGRVNSSISFSPPPKDSSNPRRRIKKTALHKSIREWVITISLILLVLPLFPREAKTITLFGAEIDSVNGYKDIINIILAFGLYRLATIFAAITPGLFKRTYLRLSLNTSSDELFSFEEQEADIQREYGNFPERTQKIWNFLGVLAEFLQYVALLLFFSFGMYNSINVLHVVLRDDVLSPGVHFMVVFLSLFFIIGAFLRTMQVIFLVFTYY
ncbi:hypothetical protein D0962_08095 [Leptolyngbyaceae cyanobacterium CCMR0082]|uniref:Uncharacterized protein n=1 Tax=Adonisia turfae CCMR0082 TaxID=2304604 RepID=A0A6M0S441_9CYAN|nr:hypothetical protein [Adonisia turfae]NEZ62741.1 hypothetical protein [Adonisia turfae CCMR0082]